MYIPPLYLIVLCILLAHHETYVDALNGGIKSLVEFIYEFLLGDVELATLSQQSYAHVSKEVGECRG